MFWEIYEESLKKIMQSSFTESEYMLFLQFGRNLMSGDLMFHKEQEQHMTKELRGYIAKEKEILRNKTKIYRALSVFASTLIVIILL